MAKYTYLPTYPYFHIVVVLLPILFLLFNLTVVDIFATGMFRPVLDNNLHENVTESNCATVVNVTVAKTVYLTVADITVTKAVYSTVVDGTVAKTIYSTAVDATVANAFYSTVI